MKVREVAFVTSATSLQALPQEGLPEVAFVGPSNVGKSTLINSLLGRKNVARVSKTPGRTQQVNYFRVNGELFFVDLPGYGFAKVPAAVQAAFRRLTEEYLSGSAHLRLLFLLLDCRRTPSARDLELKRWMDESRVPHAVVLTKADKLSRSRLQQQVALVRKAFGSTGESLAVEPHSATSGIGRRELWRAIAAATGGPAA